MKRNPIFLLALFFSGAVFCYSADLTITAEDIRVVPVYNNSANDGYHLFVRKKPDIESVLLTESTRDPARIQTNYAYRALEWNAINGDELRYLDGELLTDEYARFSIIDSTPEPDAEFGSAFHLLIPLEMKFGYPWTRNGTVSVGQDTFINIRSFAAKYGDYTDSFEDNSFLVDFVFSSSLASSSASNSSPELSIPQSVTTEIYNQDAVSSYKVIADFNNGNLFYSNGPSQLTDDIIQSVHAIPDKSRADIIFAVDTTGSMKNAMSNLRRELKDRLKTEFAQFGPVRLGLVFYRDYGDDFNYNGLPVKTFPFTTDLEEFNRNLDSIIITGIEGGDRPEAVYEALYVALNLYPWDSSASRKVILIGDAEPHPTPRGSGQYSKELIQQNAQARNIPIDMIILPEEKGASAQ
jgi:hypothetical protein